MFHCRICNPLSTLDLYDTLEAQKTQPKITIYICKRCNTLFTNPPPYNYQTPSNLVDYYLPIRSPLTQRYNRIFNYVNNLTKVRNCNFLDIGCGIGYSLLVAKEWGWDAIGIEPNSSLVSYSKSEFGLTIINDFFNAENFTKYSFDFIIVDQVLEHLYDILPFFEDVITLLKPGGILMIGVPPVDWLRLFIARIDLYISKSRLPLNIFRDLSPNFRIF